MSPTQAAQYCVWPLPEVGEQVQVREESEALEGGDLEAIPSFRVAPQSMLVLTEREMLSVCAETEMSSWSTGLW